MRRSIVVLLLGVVACGGATGAQSEDQRERHGFTDVNPAQPLAGTTRAELVAALDTLADTAEHAETELTRDLAFFTLERVEEGDVLLGSIEGARGIDRWHMCKDYQLAACEGSFDGDPEWVGDEAVTDLLTNELDGYQWGNRLYFSFRDDTDAVSVAATLVHEVNHVLNRSECSYYEDIEAHVTDDTLAYLEEYRAFFSECFYSDDADADLTGCNAHALDHLEGYELSPDLPAVLPDGDDDPLVLGELLLEASPEDGWGALVPTADVWPEGFGACSCVGTFEDDDGYCRRGDGRFAASTCCE